MNWRVSSCLCYSLRTGTLILGYVGLIISIIGSLGVAFSLPYVEEWVKEVEMKNESLTPEDIETLIKYVRIILITFLVLCILSILFDIMLLIGVYQEKIKLIKIYVIISIIGCVAGVFLTIVYLIQSFVNPALLGSLVISLLCLALQIYCTMVIYSYQLELVEDVSSTRVGSNMPKQF